MSVLDRMGRAWIKGYKPAKHAQVGPIRDALERLLPGFDDRADLADLNAPPLLRRPALIDPEEADDQPFGPAGQQDAREKVLREIRARPGQRKFRVRLIGADAGGCAITCCAALDVLDAAHITG
jgi:hypothetical protein